MKIAVTIVLLVCIALSCQTSRPVVLDSNTVSWFDHWKSANYTEDSTIINHQFSGRKGPAIYSFNDNGTYEFRVTNGHPRYPEKFHFGYYTQSGDTITLRDTLCYKIQNWNTDSPDTITCDEPSIRYLYESWVVGRLCLSDSPIDKSVTEPNIDMFYLKRE